MSEDPRTNMAIPMATFLDSNRPAALELVTLAELEVVEAVDVVVMVVVGMAVVIVVLEDVIKAKDEDKEETGDVVEDAGVVEVLDVELVVSWAVLVVVSAEVVEGTTDTLEVEVGESVLGETADVETLLLVVVAADPSRPLIDLIHAAADSE
jgi:hypothetical protein